MTSMKGCDRSRSDSHGAVEGVEVECFFFRLRSQPFIEVATSTAISSAPRQVAAASVAAFH
ncbi:hypothetical protein D881_00985 [Corynebacterium ulcerans NCTC 12077]|nr:hypothetical protein D881_00985 [Corynebacterium ulcerans NCTC 12077]